MIQRVVFLVMILGFVGCKQDNDTDPISYPTEVTFVYNGNNVTYEVVKKDYYNDANGETIDEPITKLWLGRNLGAERQALFMNDSIARGDLFQWGRKADGHQRRTSDTVQKLSETISPEHGMFIAEYSEKYDWLINSNDSLWNDRHYTNNPCPEGWRVPTGDELATEMHSWDDYTMDGAFNSSLKWVTTGIRGNKGTIRYSDMWAFIWGATPYYNGGAMSLSIIGNDTSRVTPGYRVNGQAVRCIKDVEQ